MIAFIGEWIRRIGYLLGRDRIEAQLREEMEAHREMMREPVRFGNTLHLREQSRDVWGWTWLDGLVRDLRFAGRGLRRTPTFTLVAIVSLALGLTLAASTVSVVNAYLIRSLPYPAADRLYYVTYAPPGPWEPRGMTGLDWASVEDVVEFPIASDGDSFYVSDGGYAQSLRGLRVTRGFADGLGVSVVAGRPFIEEDFASGSEPVALIGYAVWRDRFGSAPDTIGRSIRTESEASPASSETFRIVGVLSPSFFYGRNARTAVELMVPHSTPVRAYMARLRAGVPAAAAERRLTEAARRAATAPIPDEWTGVKLELARDRWLGNLQPILLGITVAVSLVLVIVGANVAVLMLLRSMQRQKEIAVRLALGSGWRHIARMLMAETILICGVALAAGIALTSLLLSAVAPLIETQLGRQAPNATGITLDTTVIGIIGGVSLLIALVLSLVPLTSWGRGVTNALQQDSRVASENRTMRRVRNGLIAFEIAGSLVLLVGCGLMVRSVVQMMTTDLGFNADGLAASRVMLRARNYADPAAYRSFHEQFAGRVATTTGAPIVFSTWPPFVPPPTHLIEQDGGHVAVNGGTISVSAGYFATFGIPMREGREFEPDEASSEAPVAVISDTLAKRLFPAGGALGQRVRDVAQTQGGSTPGSWRTVVGVAGNVRQAYDDSDQSDFYMPKMPNSRFGSFYVRTRRSMPMLFEDAQRAAASIDRDAVISLPHLVVHDDQTLSGTRFLTMLLSGFSIVTAFLAMLGIYGVTAYAVQQRQKEVAIRIALGASGRAVVGIFMREGAMLLGIGTIAGLVGGVLAARVLRNQVFGVQVFDATTYTLACALLLTSGFLAVFWAARRAAHTEPSMGIRF